MNDTTLGTATFDNVSITGSTGTSSASTDYYGYTASGDTPDFLTDASNNVTEKYLTLPGDVLLTIRPGKTATADKTMTQSYEQSITAVYDSIAGEYDARMQSYGAPAYGMLQDALAPVEQVGRAVDLGAGTGLSTEVLLATNATQVVAIDGSTAMLERLTAKLDNDSRLTVARMAISTFLSESAGQQFDTVTAICVLPYIPDYQSVIAGISRMLHPGGTCVFTYDPIVPGSPCNGAARLPGERITRVAPDAMRKCVQHAGLSVVRDELFVGRPLADVGCLGQFVVATK